MPRRSAAQASQDRLARVPQSSDGHPRFGNLAPIAPVPGQPQIMGVLNNVMYQTNLYNTRFAQRLAAVTRINGIFRNIVANNTADWGATAAAKNNLTHLIRYGVHPATNQNSVTLRAAAQPARVMIFMLEKILQYNPQGREFTMTIRGSNNEGVRPASIRNIDPNNHEQLLRIAAVMAYSNSMGDEQLVGDYENMFTHFNPDSNSEVFYDNDAFTTVSSITIHALPMEAPAPELPPPLGAAPAPPTPPAPAPAPAPAPIPAPAPQQQPLRRSSRVRRPVDRWARTRQTTRLRGPGSSAGGFFRYWLDETFPESLSHLQVYKESEHEKLVNDLSGDIKGETFEIGCLPHSFMQLQMPPHKLQLLFESISGSNTPNFPTCKLIHLAQTLSINLQVAFYDKNHQTKGRTVKKYFFGENTDPVYYLAKIENHYIADLDSNWNISAARYYIRNRKEGGYKFESLPFDKQRRVTKIEFGKETRTPTFRFASPSSVKATNGELLAILTYGYKGPARGDRENNQPSLVYPMGLADICLRAELYHLFQQEFKRSNLPNFGSAEEADAFIERSSQKMDPKPLVYLNHAPVPYNFDMGEGYDIGTNTKTFNSVPSYDWATAIANTYGTIEQTPWTFPYRYTMPARLPRKGRKPPQVINVKQQYTIIAIDSETCISYDKESLREDREPLKIHRPYMFCLAWMEDIETGLPIDVNGFQFMMDDRNLFEGHDIETYGPHTFSNALKRYSSERVRTVTRTFVGYDCAEDMSRFLGSPYFEKHHLHLIAHNARYDLNMWVRNSPSVLIEEGIFKSTSRMNFAKLSVPTTPSSDYNIRTPARRDVYLQCSLAATGIPLSAFGKTFDLPISKEYMPYSFYTEGNLFSEDEKGMLIPDLAASLHVCNDVNENGVNVWQEAKAPTEEEFITSIDNAGRCWEEGERGGKFKLWDYAEYYCVRDCEVLLMGFFNFRFELYQMRIPSAITSSNEKDDWPMSELLIEHGVSLPQFASYYFGRCGVFDGVYKFKGPLIEFMRRGVVGGKTMMAANCPTAYIADETIPQWEMDYDFTAECPSEVSDIVLEYMNDRKESARHGGPGKRRPPMKYLDVGSLYPAAMDEIAERYGGLPVGKPILQEFESGCRTLPEHIASSHFYMVSVRIHKLGRPLLFPIVSGPADLFKSTYMGTKAKNGIPDESAEETVKRLFSETDSRLFTNHPEGANIVVDRFTLEDIIEFHGGAEIEYLQAIYWPYPESGRGNVRIGEVIRYLYNSRAALVKEGKIPAGNARKLTMNSAYGRFLMKPPTSNLHFISGALEILNYVARHSVSVVGAELIRPDFATIERRKSVENFSNSTHIGAMILGVSKRIMNRVMVLCDRMFFRPKLYYPPMFYMDTDSIHIQGDLVVPVFKAFTRIYGEKVLVTPGITTDYSHSEKWLGRFNPDFDPVKDHTTPVAVCSMFIAKKVYIDLVACWKEEIEFRERTVLNAKLTTHFRMKGVPEKVVEGLCREYDEDVEKGEVMTVLDMYQRLFMGLGFLFDLSKYSTRFQMSKNFTTSTKMGFTRRVAMNPKQQMSALYEWVKSGWGKTQFPLFKHRQNMALSKKVPHFNYTAAGRIAGMGAIDWQSAEKQGAKNFLSFYDLSSSNTVSFPPLPSSTSPLDDDDDARLSYTDNFIDNPPVGDFPSLHTFLYNGSSSSSTFCHVGTSPLSPPFDCNGLPFSPLSLSPTIPLAQEPAPLTFMCACEQCRCDNIVHDEEGVCDVCQAGFHNE